MRLNTYCTAIKHGGTKEWDFAWRMASDNATRSQDRDTLLSALGCSRDPWLLVRYLSLLVDGQSGLGSEEFGRVLGAVSANPVGRALAFRYVRKHFDQLVEL